MPHPDPDRSLAIDRPLGWLIALGGCILLVSQTAFWLGSVGEFAHWWNGGGFLVVLGILLLATGGLVLPGGLLRRLWGGLPLLYWFLLATWVLGYTGADLDSALPWLWTLEPALVTLLLLVLRPRLAIATSLGFALTPALGALIVSGTVPTAMLEDTPLRLANVVYVVVFIGVRIQLERLRAAETEARSQRQRQVRAEAALEEQNRSARVVHDEVLSVLSAAMHTTGQPPPELRSHAARAIDVLEGIARGSGPRTRSGELEVLPEQMGAGLIVAHLRAIDDQFTLVTTAGSDTVPRNVVEGVCDAAAEALRNSVRHAQGAPRQVEVDLSGGSIRVVVCDDGPGIADLQDPTRLGLRLSVVGRMTDLGGSALIDSRPGQGTRVRLRWPNDTAM